MQDPSETFYRARTNVISMLIDRKYVDQMTGTTETLENRYISYDEFKQLFHIGGIAMDLVGILTPDNLPVYVKFIPKIIKETDLYNKPDASGVFQEIATQTFNMDKFKSTTDMADLRDFFKKVKVIVVFVAARNAKNKFMTTVEKHFTIPEYPNIELWPVHRLQVDYARHSLVRPHRILSEIEKQAVLHRFNLNASMMPEMCIDDPLNRWFNGLPGDMYRVDRGTTPHYVMVVNRKMPLSA